MRELRFLFGFFCFLVLVRSEAQREGRHVFRENYIEFQIDPSRVFVELVELNKIQKQI